jgi:hypothetical protein
LSLKSPKHRLKLGTAETTKRSGTSREFHSKRGE